MFTGRIIYLKHLILIISMTLFACYPTLKREARHPEESLAPVSFFYPAFRDDMDRESLISAIRKNIEYLNRLDPEKPFYYGSQAFTCRHVKESQEAFLALIEKNVSPEQLNEEIRENFLVYRATGRVGNNQVLFTGYFEPVYEASLKPDNSYRHPIYNRPGDLIITNLSLFKPEFKGKKIVGRIKGTKLLPYFSRREIVEEEVLKGQGLEIAWLKDPVDVAFLQIQGSGQLKLHNGKTINVGYSASNGLAYRSIGRYMIDKGLLNRKEMSMQSIRKYLSEHPAKVKEILNYNPSYIFFRRLKTGPVGSISVPLTPGRSLALDSKLFPKGALAFISCKKPTINERGEITEWNEFSRFVVNQDTGSAIKGAGRADIFWGNGSYAEIAAGHLKHDGELYLLIKKP
jgi:membrane-bound lytic murein transglycosylase A